MSIERQNLTPETLETLRTRFGSFHDAVIHRVQFNPFKHSDIQFIIGAIDWSDKSGKSWVNVTFEFDDLKQFHLHQASNYYFGIIGSLSIYFIKDQIHFGFLPDLENYGKFYLEEIKFKNVQFVIVAKTCTWFVSEYVQN